MARPATLWEISPMAKSDTPAGISAKLLDLFRAAKPASMSERQWCLKGDVSTSFFTDLKNGRQPGIDTVERMAGAIGLTLSDFLEGHAPPNRIIPDEDELESLLSEIVDDEVTLQTRLADLPRIFASSLHGQLERYRSGLVRRAEDALPAPDTDALSPEPTKRSARAGSRTT